MRKILKDNASTQYNNMDYTLQILQEAAKNGENKEIRNKHGKNIKDMLGTSRIFN